MTARPQQFSFDNTYARDLTGFYVAWQASDVPAPALVLFNRDLAQELGLDPAELETEDGARLFAGTHLPEGASPLAQVYAGHQFGGFSPQLGDGRALLLGEVVDVQGRRRDIQLKGSGPTPFSRGGDGKAVLGPVLREYVIGEAMHALGIPTTRALAAVTTGENVFRDGDKPGAVLTRVASSHLRVGTFQYFAARGETDKVRRLADYAISRHAPDLAGADDRYLRLFARVVERQAKLVADWILVGFVHGVMNTDNTTISGETIDYGPCAFLDTYDPATVFSSIDQGGRYAFGRQPMVLQWNLARLAEALLAVIAPDNVDRAVDLASIELGRFPDLYEDALLGGMRPKLGLAIPGEGDKALFEDLLELMRTQKADYTLAFRRLGDAAAGDETPFRALLADPASADAWLARWHARRGAENASAEAEAMNRVNPLYMPRNHLVEAALTAAEAGDPEPVRRLLDVLKDPYKAREGLDAYAEPAPAAFGPYRTFCGT